MNTQRKPTFLQPEPKKVEGTQIVPHHKLKKTHGKPNLPTRTRKNYGELMCRQPEPTKTLGKPVFWKETKENLRKTKKTKDIPKNTKKALG